MTHQREPVGSQVGRRPRAVEQERPSPAGRRRTARSCVERLVGVVVDRLLEHGAVAERAAGVPASVIVSVALDPLDPVAAGRAEAGERRARSPAGSRCSRLSPVGRRRAVARSRARMRRSWPAVQSCAARRASVERDASSGGRVMKELVYHRHPAAGGRAQRPTRSAFIDGDVPRDVRAASRSGRAAQRRAARPRRRPRRPLRGDGAEQPPVPRAATTPRSSAPASINPLNLRLAPKELEFILADSGTKVCFTDAFFAPRDRAGARRGRASSTS